MIKTDIRVPIGYTAEDINSAIVNRIPVSADELSDVRIVKRGLDLTDKSNIHYKMTVAISLGEDREA